MPRTSQHVEFQQCSSRVRVERSESRNVTSDKSRSAKTLVGTRQINSLASSDFTEQHAPSSEPQWRATFPAVFLAATPSADFNYSCPAIAINRRPVTLRAPSQAPHNESCVFTERVNKSAYHLQPSIDCIRETRCLFEGRKVSQGNNQKEGSIGLVSWTCAIWYVGMAFHTYPICPS
jgi:hypothetical protein